VQTTTSSEEEAHRVATALLEPRLAACVQVVGPVQSHYWWRGSLESATEWLCLAKTTQDRVDEVTAVVRAINAYDTPEVIVVAIVGGDENYLQWIADTVHDDPGDGRVGAP